MKERNFVPCRVCGVEHSNPQSSSICPDCGAKEAEARRRRIADGEDAAYRREEAARRLRSLELSEARDVDALKDWLREHVLPVLEVTQ